jgi:hypothetical protein
MDLRRVDPYIFNFAICMAMSQTIAFTAVKMWELLFESVDEERPKPPLVVDCPLDGATTWRSVTDSDF